MSGTPLKQAFERHSGGASAEALWVEFDWFRAGWRAGKADVRKKRERALELTHPEKEET